MVHVGAAHEHAASEPAPNEDDAAQAPEPASASAGAGAGDVAYGRRSSQRRQMPPPVDLAALLEETESSGQDAAGATQGPSARHSASFSFGSRSCSSSDCSSPPPTLSRHSNNSSPTSVGSQSRRRSRERALFIGTQFSNLYTTQSDQQSRDEQVQSAVHPWQGYGSKSFVVFACISFFVFICILALTAARRQPPGPRV